MTNKYKYIYKILIFTSSLILTFTACGCKGIKEEYSKSGFAFDTVIGISIYDNDKNHADKVLTESMNLCDYYDSLFSINNPDSDIYKINHSDGESVKVSVETLNLIKKSIYYSEISDGLFDITVEPLYELWDFNGSDHNSIPDDEMVKQALTYVDYHGIKLSDEKQTITLRKGCEITLGALAKGYIADKLKEQLVNEGITSGIINLGGNILSFGTKPDGSLYKIGIQKPFSQTGEIAKSVEITDNSVVTSGTYQRFFKYDDKIYHHIINPDNGYPANNELDSVTIICEKSLDADAYSTICMLLGYDKAEEFIKSKDNVTAVFIDKQGNIKEVGR